LTSTRSFDDRRVVLTANYWRHIQFRHPEVGNEPGRLLDVIREPDELYLDEKGGTHALKRLDDNRFIVVIYEFDNLEGFIRTAYITSEGRKKRRYGKLRRLTPF
jgi:hypothetical protein